jgi:hypothetical protein
MQPSDGWMWEMWNSSIWPLKWSRDAAHVPSD